MQQLGGDITETSTRKELTNGNNVESSKSLHLVLDVDGCAVLQLEHPFGVWMVRDHPRRNLQEQVHESEPDLDTDTDKNDWDPDAAGNYN
ncbi:hypothetical protein OGAPHI_001450 [Ogataea philodendri]|uniref:Uncharacterized protein n=1 Tax=Ogataea philodendri TaxID=1378263 RepID=A0A9P8PDL1_9ASCO|nr:uncharacterized protein OGAPHI_001450 [Ogataea philodendri]KAH3669329.1 hypothetical protein OGAPHI_001450 [Ogataea philodendri]